MDSLAPQTVTKKGVYPPQRDNVQDETVNKRFGLAVGNVVVVNAAGDVVIYAPATGNRVRLKWTAWTSSTTNTAETIITMRFGTGATTAFYGSPMGAPGAFSHSTTREGPVEQGGGEGALVVHSTAVQLVYVNIDVEEF